MKKKPILAITIVVFALIALTALTACSPATPTEEPPVTPVEEEPVASVEEQPDAELVLTLEELSEFNGQDGNKAYIAVDGVIYDVTDSEYWVSGDHHGFTAGKDLTREIKEDSPHGISKLEDVIKVGNLAE